MNDDLLAPIRSEIAQAHALGLERKPRLAVRAFARARDLVLANADPKALERAVARDQGAYARERETYRSMISQRQPAGRKLVLFGDSLGLPRTDAKDGPTLGAETTYPWHFGTAFPERSVVSICQRFFTTDHILAELEADPDLGAGSDVIVHVGLNDCANRMFLERERIALSLLPEKLRLDIVGFSQKYRREIIRFLPPHHYVPRARFRNNLSRIATLLQDRKARRIILATIILPPARSWPGTPGMNRNFATYNLEIMEAVQRHDLTLLDFDRHVWAALQEGALLDDGMHLSPLGHRLFAETAGALLPKVVVAADPA